MKQFLKAKTLVLAGTMAAGTLVGVGVATTSANAHPPARQIVLVTKDCDRVDYRTVRNTPQNYHKCTRQLQTSFRICQVGTGVRPGGRPRNSLPSADGRYGPQTEAYVRAWKATWGDYNGDGYPNRRVWDEINKCNGAHDRFILDWQFKI